MEVSMHSKPPAVDAKSSDLCSEPVKASKLADPAIGQAVSPVGQSANDFCDRFFVRALAEGVSVQLFWSAEAV